MRAPRLSTAAGACFVLWGLAIGLVQLHDNSFMTHVATGRLILAHGVPTQDPYSFTAAGHPWVIESWLASALYGVVDQWWGGHGLQMLHALLAAVLAGLVWVLSRPAGTLAGRICVTAAVLLVGTGYWSPRPLLIGLILFAVLIALTETDMGSPWLLAPIMWIWLNVHGSWPIGVAYLVVRLVGRRVDRHPVGQLPRRVRAAVVGCAFGLFNPFGWRLVAYPLVVITKHAAFAHIAEWQSPSFSDPVNVVLLVEAFAALALLVWRRGAVEDALVVAVFTAAGLLASRNVPVAALAVAPSLARGLAGLGSVTGSKSGRLPAVALAGIAVVGALLVSGAVGQPAWNLAAYPVREVSWMQGHGLAPGRVAAPDYVGNYLELRYGAKASVFIDDRVDMFPLAVDRASLTLLTGGQGWQGVLSHYGVRVVLWPRNQPLAGLVSESPHWKVVLRDRSWIVAVPVTHPIRA